MEAKFLKQRRDFLADPKDPGDVNNFYRRHAWLKRTQNNVTLDDFDASFASFLRVDPPCFDDYHYCKLMVYHGKISLRRAFPNMNSKLIGCAKLCLARLQQPACVNTNRKCLELLILAARYSRRFSSVFELCKDVCAFLNALTFDIACLETRIGFLCDLPFEVDPICFLYSIELSLLLDSDFDISEDLLDEVFQVAVVDTSICLRLFSELLTRYPGQATAFLSRLFDLFSMNDMQMMTSYPKSVYGLDLGFVSLILKFLETLPRSSAETCKLLSAYAELLRPEVVGFNTAYLHRKISKFLTPTSG